MTVGATALVAVALSYSAPPSTVKIPRACLPPHDTYPFCNASLPLTARVDDLISRLTLDEKPTLLVARNSPNGNISRLGVPEYDWGGNCIHGVQSRCAADGRCPTSYPNPNALGASFNKTVWRGMGEVIGLELRSLWLQGVGEDHDSNLPHIGLDCWSPNIGIVRDPRWGRNLETPSEDPTVCGSFGSEVTKGLQRSPLDARYVQAVVTLKHFDANSLEGNWGPGGKITRHTVDATVSKFDLQTSYLPAFRTAVVEGGALGVMCSYNAINGVPSCANPWLLGETLRGDWGFEGYVTSDSGAVVDVFKNHHFTANWTQTVTKTLEAGCDIESASWPHDHAYATGGPYIDYAPAAVRSGELDEAVIDDALRHSVGLRFRLGLFDVAASASDEPLWNVPPSVVQSDEHVRRSKDATAQGLVLLQNGGGAGADAAASAVLPLKAGLKLAVLGPHAADQSVILGNYLGQICPASMGDRSCVQSVAEMVGQRNARAGGTTTNATGCATNTTDESGFSAALALAADADAIVFVGGLDLDIERESHDRHDIGLPGVQPKLLSKLLALGKPLALVLFHGGIVTFPPDILAAPNLALVSAGYPGIYGAEAIANALLEVSADGALPSRFGKTPLTWYSEKGWADADFDMLSFDMGKAPGRTHVYYSGTPQWAFGAGLSYARTELSAAHGAPKAAGAPPTIEVAVRNLDAKRATDEVVFLFLVPAAGTVPPTEPAAKMRRTLVAFERVTIAPRGAAAVKFDVRAEAAQLRDAAGDLTTFEGEYDFVVSTGGIDVPLRFRCGAAGCDRAD